MTKLKHYITTMNTAYSLHTHKGFHQNTTSTTAYIALNQAPPSMHASNKNEGGEARFEVSACK